MKIDLKYLKELYENINKDKLLENCIYDFNDFIDYIITTIIDNLNYDFKINDLDIKKLFKD